MKTIFKYPLSVIDEQEISMPVSARILCVQVQRGVPCLWALVDPDDSQTPRSIRIVGTGHPIRWGAGIEHYIGTFQALEGALVFHVFEVRS